MYSISYHTSKAEIWRLIPNRVKNSKISSKRSARVSFFNYFKYPIYLKIQILAFGNWLLSWFPKQKYISLKRFYLKVIKTSSVQLKIEIKVKSTSHLSFYWKLKDIQVKLKLFISIISDIQIRPLLELKTVKVKY